jgi:hypothetical protein
MFKLNTNSQNIEADNNESKFKSVFNSAQDILKKTISDTKLIGEKRKDRIKEKNTKKAYFFIILAFLSILIYSYMFMYPELYTYITANTKINTIQGIYNNYNNVIIPNLNNEKNTHKAAYDIEFKEKEEALELVFPKSIDKLGIIKRLENFATSINSSSPPFEFNSISFSEAKKIGNYTVLPISTSIYASKTNFDRFIQLINLSGDINNEVKIRLMEISNINIRYRGIDPKTGEDKGVDFTVKLNAYSR